MFEEEDRPRRAKRFEPAVLDGWSAEELADYIAALRDEIARTETALARKDVFRGAAEAFFRKG